MHALGFHNSPWCSNADIPFLAFTRVAEDSMSPKVVHCKKEPYDVYIGRPSNWGNPYVIGIDGTREEVIKKYEYLILHSQLLFKIDELTGKVLGCWCKPLPCHGDVLLKLANPHLQE